MSSNTLILLFMMSMIMAITTLISVAFITLLERKILGFMQLRLGPNKTGMKGILQPFSDAIKLYTKELNLPNISNKTMFFASPCLSLTLTLSMWTVMPYLTNYISMKMSFMILLSMMGLQVYPILIAGWSSNSSYSILGGLRALAQTISYEVSLIFIMLSNFILVKSLSLFIMVNMQKELSFMFFIMQLFLWMISCLAELNRTPFDFAESESELVSGFNTEYSSGSFAIIFMAEYMMILFFSMLTPIMFTPTKINLMNLPIMSMVLMFFFIWSRATLPRYRYDMLMNLSWKIILPLSTFNLFFSATMNVSN
uniref:NADH dehydrogenase subunit 1 n=1 Tax=Bregmatothrips sinensis TaxID=3045418 RepID=UPI0030E3BE0A